MAVALAVEKAVDEAVIKVEEIGVEVIEKEGVIVGAGGQRAGKK